MSDDLTHDERAGAMPSPEQMLGRRWQGSVWRGDAYSGLSLFESRDHPGFIHIEMTFGSDGMNTIRPVRASGVEMFLSAILAPRGIALADVAWREVATWEPSPQRPRPPEVVYFLAAGPFIKIGKSNGDATKRVAELQTGCPYPITVMATIRGGIAEEHAAHRRFAHLRAQGEWFHAAPELLNHIQTLTEA